MKIEQLINLRKQETAGQTGNDSAFVTTLFNTQSLQLLAQHRSITDRRPRKSWKPMDFGQWLNSLSPKCTSGSGIIAGLVAAFLFCFSAPAATPAQSVSLMWDASAGPVAGYVVHYGTTKSNYTTHLNVGTNTSAVISGLKAGQTNYFAVTAYDSAGTETMPSNEIKYFVPGILTLQRTNAAAPARVQFPVATGRWYELQASTNLKSWTTIWTTSVTTSNTWLQYTDTQAATMPQRYYRLVNH